MPGDHSRVTPISANKCPPSASDEVSVLELHLQRQLEEDIARIFDESIYSDVEVGCGKLKILTHSCILKTRTNKFYRKLETILNLNIERNIFDEIYSFISDVYTECNIKSQENEIISYLNENITVAKPIDSKSPKNKVDTEEPEVFLTPKCISPYVENSFQKTISSSPSTDLTKEYYALVPIEGNCLLEKELKEQDVLSNAFKSIIKSQSPNSNKLNGSHCKKPTTLFLDVRNNKIVDHSTSLNNIENISNTVYNNKVSTVVIDKNIKRREHDTEYYIYKNLKNFETVTGVLSETDPKSQEAAYSPDSLIADDPSTSSDYLSAANTCSPGVNTSSCLHLNVGDHIIKMDNNIITSSDSGLENTGLLESLTSHKDVTITDFSLTESTLQDLTTDEPSNSHDSSPLDKNNVQKNKQTISQNVVLCGNLIDLDDCQENCQSPKLNDVSSKTTKEEKQRQNEEIVILESSSLSSETGSWESVFPPRVTEKDVCEKFINHERGPFNEEIEKGLRNTPAKTEPFQSLVQKLPYKSTSCFIDAASLADEEDNSGQINTDASNQNKDKTAGDSTLNSILAPSQPVPCSSNKVELSPNDWSESNDNEDSLEQTLAAGQNSGQEDLSPTIFEMTFIAEDTALPPPAFEEGLKDSMNIKPSSDIENLSKRSFLQFTDTPHNSLKICNVKPAPAEETVNDTDITVILRDGHLNMKRILKCNESSPILSGGASVEDHLPQMSSQSPLARRKIENMPIVSGAYVHQKEDNEESNKSPKQSSSTSWVVDMSINISDAGNTISDTNHNIKVGENTNPINCSNTRENCNKSRSSVDSDSSEKSYHKFYIDLSTLSVTSSPESKNKTDGTAEKKNIFSMFIDLGEKSTVKEMPARLSSSLNTKKCCEDTKNSSKNIKSTKNASECTVAPDTNDLNDAKDNTFEKYESLCNDPNISISEIIALPKKENEDCLKNKLESGNQSADKNMPTTSDCNDTYTCASKQGDIKDKLAFQTEIKIHEGLKNDQATGQNSKFIQQQSHIQKHSNTRRKSNTEKESFGSEDPSASDLFVKLSDLDKPANKSITERATNERPVDERMTRSIPENNWCGQNQNSGTIPIEVISSFHSENALSLNRLFPHLQNEFSRSMPGSLSSRNRSPHRAMNSSSPGDIDDQVSDMSEMSSVQSSACRSVVGNSTTEEISQTSSIITHCQSRLGQDLLRMFLEEIAPDVIVEVSGRRIKAHKCILSSRCQYFAGILSGGWVESAGNVILLPPFTYSVVHFAMCHIYSGTSVIPESINIVELATLADLLGLEGLKEAIMFTLKSKYCHHFHRPCPVCTAGVLECFPLSSLCGLDDLYLKCLRWITKYFSKVWPTKAFASLPADLLERCYQQHVVNMTIENFADTVYGCGITLIYLRTSGTIGRATETVERLCRRLINAAAHFAAPRLVTILRAIVTLPGDPPATAMQALDECLEIAIQRAPPEEACRAYAYLSQLVKEIRAQQLSKPDLISNGNQNIRFPGEDNLAYTRANCWRQQCEEILVQAAPRVVGTQAFRDLPADLRKRLRDMGCIMYGVQAIPVVASPLQSRRSPSNSTRQRGSSLLSHNVDIDHMRASFVPYSPKPACPPTHDVIRSSNDLRDMRKSVRSTAPKVKTTKAQEERAKYNIAKNSPSQNRPKPTTTTRLFENAKPRYLEPKMQKSIDKKASPANKFVPKMISSSESSRNSSPIQVRNQRTSRMKSRQNNDIKGQAISQDSLATCSRPRTAEPSTDSLSESQISNKYATYTKTKHSKGSVESVQMSKNHATIQSNNRGKTKIPVPSNQSVTKLKNIDTSKKLNAVGTANATSSSPLRIKSERKAPGSLMNATKSSSAKVVQRIVKDSSTKSTLKNGKGIARQGNKTNDQSSEIPAMDRSGTFLKDEPTFGDKTTKIDIDE